MRTKVSNKQNAAIYFISDIYILFANFSSSGLLHSEFTTLLLIEVHFLPTRNFGNYSLPHNNFTLTRSSKIFFLLILI